jgi:phosphoribosylaminoimidazolecarboxamide formyltransferase/IMP cyclohydrolase
MNRKRRALFSLNDTSDADRFAEELISQGWDIVASSETVELLSQKGLPVQDIADFTGVHEDYGFPPTMHARVEHALTGKSGSSIDLVYVIPYPLAAGNDVGGRTLLALAVKGGRIPVMSVEDMRLTVSAIRETGEVPDLMRMDLVNKTCYEIANHYSSLISDRGKYDVISGSFAYSLMNGENPYQVPASVFEVSAGDPLALTNFKQLSGEAPCFTNIADADCILNTLCLAAEAFRLNSGSLPYLCVAAKHGNACGMGVSNVSPEDALDKALFGNPRSIWGGEIITNFPVDGKLAEAILKSRRRENLLGSSYWMLDIVMAPSFSMDAISIMGNRKERKLLANEVLVEPYIDKSVFIYRSVRGGFLRQPPANYILNVKECAPEGKVFSKNEISSLIIAWAVAFSSNHGGNEVVLAKDAMLLASGGGPSTVEAARVAVIRAKECGHEIEGAVFAADAFFPFPDAPAMLCDAGVTMGCVPAGGKREIDIQNFFHEKNVPVVFLQQNIRGFCRH